MFTFKAQGRKAVIRNDVVVKQPLLLILISTALEAQLVIYIYNYRSIMIRRRLILVTALRRERGGGG